MHDRTFLHTAGTPSRTQPVAFLVEKEEEFAVAIDQAITAGRSVKTPIEVLRAFDFPECDDESADPVDWLGRRNPALVQEVGDCDRAGET